MIHVLLNDVEGGAGLDASHMGFQRMRRKCLHDVSEFPSRLDAVPNLQISAWGVAQDYWHLLSCGYFAFATFK